MVVLDVEYKFGKNNTKSITFDTKSKDDIDWIFLDNLLIRENNIITIFCDEEKLFLSLKLFQKKQNLHIFNCLCHIEEKYHTEIEKMYQGDHESDQAA